MQLHCDSCPLPAHHPRTLTVISRVVRHTVWCVDCICSDAEERLSTTAKRLQKELETKSQAAQAAQEAQAAAASALEELQTAVAAKEKQFAATLQSAVTAAKAEGVKEATSRATAPDSYVLSPFAHSHRRWQGGAVRHLHRRRWFLLL